MSLLQMMGVCRRATITCCASCSRHDNSCVSSWVGPACAGGRERPEPAHVQPYNDQSLHTAGDKWALMERRLVSARCSPEHADAGGHEATATRVSRPGTVQHECGQSTDEGQHRCKRPDRTWHTPTASAPQVRMCCHATLLSGFQPMLSPRQDHMLNSPRLLQLCTAASHTQRLTWFHGLRLHGCSHAGDDLVHDIPQLSQLRY